MLAELVDERLELFPRLRRREVVVLEIADHAGQIGGEQIEGDVSFRSDFVGEFLSTSVARFARLARKFLDRVALCLHNLAQSARDVVEDTAEIIVLQCLATLATKILEHVAQALHLLAVRCLEAGLHHPAQRGIEIAVIEQIVGQVAEDVTGIHVESDLTAIPSGVTNTITLGHMGTVPALSSR
ncbi:unannotated protein [freshwater metagenome]|uniref:Unannotated protein n=1 Tax=freshwater metagenome TaxID=449393 RepID=A0A6J6HE69_9ZZZZ